jgi:three-Cys-motif partner protein
LLDPYGLHLQWEVFKTAAQMGTVDILINFSIVDLNMNCGLRDPDKVTPRQPDRLTRFWGDEGWRTIVHTTGVRQPNLFGTPEKTPNEAIVNGFCDHLRDDAGFACVAPPLPMRDSGGAIYYLVFASQQPLAKKIATEILAKYR